MIQKIFILSFTIALGKSWWRSVNIFLIPCLHIALLKVKMCSLLSLLTFSYLLVLLAFLFVLHTRGTRTMGKAKRVSTFWVYSAHEKVTTIMVVLATVVPPEAFHFLV